MDLLGSSMDNAEILQSIATLLWVHNNDHRMVEQLTTARLGYELYQRLSADRDLEALRNQTIAAIVKYVNDHPKAKKEDLQKEVAKHIIAFAQKVEKL